MGVYMRILYNIARIRQVFIVIAVLLLLVSGSAFAYHDTGGHWAAEEIDLLSAKEIVGGYSDGSFRPNRDLTRAEFSKMVVSALNMENEAYSLYGVPSYFTDISGGHWAKGFIELAYELGIVQGNGDGTFQPERVIRRDEITAMLYRAMRLPREAEGETYMLQFADAKAIPAWAEKYIAKAVEWGLITGYPDNTFRPAQRTTRAEAVVFLSRLMGARGDVVEFAGILKEINFDEKIMTVELFNEEYFFSYVQSIVFYEQERNYNLTYLQGKLPMEIGFVVDSNGRIAYLQKAENLQDRLLSFSSLEPAVSIMEGMVAEIEALNFFSSVYTGVAPRNSLEITKQEMKVDELMQGTGARGTGQIIAIIDTGVDPGHPDLQKTSTGDVKIIDWVDFTGELQVDTSRTISANNSRPAIDGRNYTIEGITSKSGRYHYGFIAEDKLYRDLNFNGNINDKYLVILSDPEVAGRYDTVYIDVANAGRIDANKGYKLFSERQQYFTIPSREQARTYNMVVGAISAEADWVRFGADFNGHGTHVAGIAAANGGIEGVAPGSQLMVLKALNAMGETNWDLLRDAIVYAAENGAHIINLSLGYYLDPTAGNNSLTQLIADISEDYNVVFTVATGNRGPGLTSLATPGNAKDALSVGAFISPAMWKEDYGWIVPADSLWYFSSVGPRKDGLMIPDIVAPGSVVSTAPMWAARPYALGEGTSMAAPHAAGAVALLRDALARLDRYPNAEEIRRAIALGARPLNNYTPAEVGAGVIDVVEAWRKLLLVDRAKPLVSQTFNKRLAYGAGLYARDFIPGEIAFNIFNYSDVAVDIQWDSTESWLVPQIERTRIATEGKRTIPVSYSIPEEPGFYAGFLRGDILSTYGYDLTALVSVVRPYNLDSSNQHSVELSGELPAAQFARYFFRVPPNVEQLSMNLKIDVLAGNPRGRVRGHIIDPDGNEFYMTEYIGLGPPGALVNTSTSANAFNPKEGVWEIVVYSSASLSEFNVSQSYFSLQVSIEGVDNDVQPVGTSSSWLIGGIAAAQEYDGYLGITYQVIDKNSKRPVNGIIELEGKYYEVRNGKLFLRITQ